MTRTLLLAVTVASASGCAFDIVHVKQTPVSLASLAPNTQPWALKDEVKVSIGTGYRTVLRAGTHWEPVGRIKQGVVFKTQDQVVKVEASNIHEAYIVVNDANVVGFYLPVERAFTAARPPKPIAPSYSVIPIQNNPTPTSR